jgi:tetratricopeptide (TPR) repeat protein
MRSSFLLTGAGGILLAAVGQLRADSMELANGQKRDVQITSAKWDSVQYVVGKAPTTLSGDQVLSIVRDSTFLQAGREALEGGDYSKAVTSLGAVGDKAKDWEQAEARYLTARALHAAGNSKEAERVLKAYLDRYKGDKDWFVPAATLLMGDALLASRQPGTAEIHYKELDQYGSKWAIQGKLGQGKALLGKGESGATEARRLFDDVARSAAAPPGVRQQAVVWKARAYLLQKQPQQAVKELTSEFFDAPKPGEIGYTAERAEATVLMGRAQAMLGGKPALEEAEIWLLRAVALYRKSPEIYSQACSGLSEVYTQLGNKSRADEWKQRGSTAGASAPAAQVPAPAPAAPAKAPQKGAKGKS